MESTNNRKWNYLVGKKKKKHLSNLLYHLEYKHNVCIYFLYVLRKYHIKFFSFYFIGWTVTTTIIKIYQEWMNDCQWFESIRQKIYKKTKKKNFERFDYTRRLINNNYSFIIPTKCSYHHHMWTILFCCCFGLSCSVFSFIILSTCRHFKHIHLFTLFCIYFWFELRGVHSC